MTRRVREQLAALSPDVATSVEPIDAAEVDRVLARRQRVALSPPLPLGWRRGADAVGADVHHQHELLVGALRLVVEGGRQRLVLELHLAEAHGACRGRRGAVGRRLPRVHRWRRRRTRARRVGRGNRERVGGIRRQTRDGRRRAGHHVRVRVAHPTRRRVHRRERDDVPSAVRRQRRRRRLPIRAPVRARAPRRIRHRPDPVLLSGVVATVR